MAKSAAGILKTPLMEAAPQAVLDGLAATVSFPKRLGNPDEFAGVALTMLDRLDGAIRMAPR